MRRRRVKVEGAYYHVMSRCALQAHLLKGDGGEVKEMFMKMLRRAETFSGVQVVNYCVMDNHFHLLVHVPRRREVSDGELERRMRALYGDRRASGILDRWAELLEKKGCESVVQREREAMRRRMYDLSEFVKTFKQRFSLWYCKNHGNLEGTIWQGVFHSVLVEGRHDALGAVSTYITLNPVRAGLVDDPGDYAWSGYGAACAGDAAAKRALLSTCFGSAAMAAKWEAYQSMLEAKVVKDAAANEVGASDGGADKAAKTKTVLRSNEGRSVSETMRERDRGIARGLAIGSRGFVLSAVVRFTPGRHTPPSPRSIGVGEFRTPLFCAGRRWA
jgi:REP element-mobilizing transposase RayT